MLGEVGERFAVSWLSQQGLALLDRNLEVDGGEIDLLMSDGQIRVAVEVRTITSGGDPIDAVGPAKRAHVRRLAGKVKAARVDYLGIGIRDWGVEVHWLPG